MTVKDMDPETNKKASTEAINGIIPKLTMDSTVTEKRSTMSSVTLRQNMIPAEMRIPYILSGYRRTYQPWSYYLSSIFHIHNETLNIWTHLVGSLIISYQIYVYYNIYDVAESELRMTVLGYGFCAVSALLCSTIAHLFHSKSRHINYTVFLFDYLGVCFWVYGTGIMTVYGVSEPSLYPLVKDYYLKWQCFCTLINYVNICAAKLWYAHDLGNPRRTLMVVGGIGGQFTMNSIPFSYRYYKCMVDQDCQLSSLNHITYVILMFVFVALLFMLRQPEKSWPGKFDIVGGSHQIFHISVIFAQTLELAALYKDFQTGANHHCEPDITEILIEIGTIAGVGMTVLFIFRNIAFSHLKDS